ncbi:MAG: tetratricopeptide repeat protein [Bryobacteraceae bacterium]
MKFIYIGLLILFPSLAEECEPTDPATPLQELDRRAQIEFRRMEFAKSARDFNLAACAALEKQRPAYALYGIAAEALAVRDWPRARQVLLQADGIQPEFPLALAMLAKADTLAGNTEGLSQSLSEIARRFGSDGRLHADLAQDLLHDEQYDFALAEALRAEAAGVSDARTRLNLAVLENQAGAFADAARLASAIAQRPDLPNSVRAKAAGIAGLSYDSLGQPSEAIHHLREAVQLDPGQELPYVALGRIYSSQHDLSTAINILQQGRKRFVNAALLLALGSALLAAEDYRSATNTLAEVIQRFPKEFEAYLKLATAYRNMGLATKATETLRRLASQSPNYPMLHVLVAESLLDEERPDYSSSLEELAEAEKTSPEDYDICYLRGRVLMGMRQYQRAARSFLRATELRPSEPGAHYQLGLAYRNLGETALAKEQFDFLAFLKSGSEPPGARN